MCARYVIDEEFPERLNKALTEIGLKGEYKEPASGEVKPSEAGLILELKKTGTGKDADAETEKEAEVKEQVLEGKSMRWGFPCYDKKGLIINARMENIEERKSFAKGIKNNRCVIPVSGFFEWDNNRDKVKFIGKNKEILFLGGIYDIFEGEERFTIITKEANEVMKPVHDRMPFMIMERDLIQWFSEDFRGVFETKGPEITDVREFRQMSLFDY